MADETAIQVTGGRCATGPSVERFIAALNAGAEHWREAGVILVQLRNEDEHAFERIVAAHSFITHDMLEIFYHIGSIQIIFFAAGTIEDGVCRKVNEKIGRIDVLNDGLPDGDFALAGERASCADIPAAVLTNRTEVEVASPTAKRQAKRDMVDALAAKLTPDMVARAHAAMKRLKGDDWDKASTVNGVGFGKTDGEFGHKLADAEALTPRMAAHAVLLARKYRKQVGDIFPETYEA